MAPTGRGGLRPYQPSKFQPFVILCLLVTVTVIGFNFWNLTKKNSLLLVELGKVQNNLKRLESEKKDCSVQLVAVEDQRKQHEEADQKKEIVLEDTRRIVEDLKAEADILRQNITKLMSHIASAELSGSLKENKSRSECEQRLEDLRLQMQSSCVAMKEQLQQETADQLNTMKKQLKLQYEETQQLDQMLQQQKQHPGEEEKKELQQEQQGGEMQQQEQQKQQQRQIQGGLQNDRKLPSGQQIQRQEQQRGLIVDQKQLGKGEVDETNRQVQTQKPGIQLELDNRQVPEEKQEQQDQTRFRDPYQSRQGEQRQEHKDQQEIHSVEEVQRMKRMQPPRIKETPNSEQFQQPGTTQMPSIGDQDQSQREQRAKLLFQQSDQDALDTRRRRELAGGEAARQATGQRHRRLHRSKNYAAADNSTKRLQDQDGVGKDGHHASDRNGLRERIYRPTSVRPDEKLIPNDQDRQDSFRSWQDWPKKKNPDAQLKSIDPENPPEGNSAN